MKQLDEQSNPKAIQSVIESSIDQIKALAETNTIIGKPILTPSGLTIIPVSKVSVGFVVGGGEYGANAKRQSMPFPMAASTGGGVSLNPIGFLIDEVGVGVKFVPSESATGSDAIVLATANILSSILSSRKPKEHE